MTSIFFLFYIREFHNQIKQIIPNFCNKLCVTSEIRTADFIDIITIDLPCLVNIFNSTKKKSISMTSIFFLFYIREFHNQIKQIIPNFCNKLCVTSEIRTADFIDIIAIDLPCLINIFNSTKKKFISMTSTFFLFYIRECFEIKIR